MQLLAIDTATEACSVALVRDGHWFTRYEVLGRGHAEHVLLMVDSVLAEAGIALATLDAIAFGRGPGAFTGVRIAASVAQGLAFGAGLPVVPVSDLAALAARAAEPASRIGSRQVLVCMDARMGQVYCGAFDVGDAERPAELAPERLADPGDVRLPHAGTWFGAGHGFSAYPALAALLGSSLAGTDPALLPRAREIALLALHKVAEGRTQPPETAQPVYLRDEVATRPGRARPG